MSIEALKLTLEALQDYVDEYGPWSDDSGAQFVLRVGREALAQPKEPEQEPVAITITGKLGNIYSFTGDYSLKKGDKVYTTQPHRKPLTHEQYIEIGRRHWLPSIKVEQIHKEIEEAAHGIKE